MPFTRTAVCAAWLAVCFTMNMDAPIMGISQAEAGPPAHAPAHGYRNKHKQKYYKHHKKHRTHSYGHGYPLFPALPLVSVECLPGKSIINTVVGGATGALIGNQFGKGDGKTAATIGGGILGSLLGMEYSQGLHARDLGCANQALEYAQPNTQVGWTNPDDGSSYVIAPTRDYRTRRGQYCREYQTQASIGGAIQKFYGTACKQPDGSWRIVE